MGKNFIFFNKTAGHKCDERKIKQIFTQRKIDDRNRGWGFHKFLMI